ncbi:MAG: hypothetical protein Q8N63_02640 [Nanoarchaeota archaeon]|nr:hypothetical protein [Nanoarchaeota archaeon]
MKSKNLLNKIADNIKTNLKKIACSSILGLACIAGTLHADTNINDSNDINWIESDKWLITSYGNANEALYSGKKTGIFNRFDEFLGLYREDFLFWVMINGSGIGDGIGNNKTQFLCYDYYINDGITHYLIDHPQGAYSNRIFSWLEDNPSVAVNPPLPQGTKVRFKDLNLEGELDYPWIEDLLLSKTFYSDDKFFLPEEEKHKKKIDVYVGIMQTPGYGWQSLYIQDAKLLIEQPSSDLNKDNFIDFLDFQALTDNWLKEDKTQYNMGDLNYDNKVDFVDYALFVEGLKKRK